MFEHGGGLLPLEEVVMRSHVLVPVMRARQSSGCYRQTLRSSFQVSFTQSPRWLTDHARAHYLVAISPPWGGGAPSGGMVKQWLALELRCGYVAGPRSWGWPGGWSSTPGHGSGAVTTEPGNSMWCTRSPPRRSVRTTRPQVPTGGNHRCPPRRSAPTSPRSPARPSGPWSWSIAIAPAVATPAGSVRAGRRRRWARSSA